MPFLPQQLSDILYCDCVCGIRYLLMNYISYVAINLFQYYFTCVLYIYMCVCVCNIGESSDDSVGGMVQLLGFLINEGDLEQRNFI